jgi:hypothetical protein
MLLAEPDYVVDESLAGLLARLGVEVGEGIVVDPRDHYFTDEQMIAVQRYGNHPAARGLALSFYPGARPLTRRDADGVTTVALVATSPETYVVTDRLDVARKGEGKAKEPRILAIASEGRLTPDAKPFRVLVFGDADFASNSFFPYLANSDVVLGGLAWLIREERAPAMKPPVEVLPTVTLTNTQMRSVFILTVLLMPGFVAAAGGVVWWRRQR